MLKKLANLFTTASSATAIRAALDAEWSAAEEAEREITRLGDERKAAVLAGDHAAAVAAEAKIAEAERTIERVGLLAPDLHRRLAEVESAEHDADRQKFWEQYRHETAALRAPIEQVLAGLVEIDAVVARASTAGHAQWAQTYLTRPPRLASGAFVLDPQVFERWVKHLSAEAAPGLATPPRRASPPTLTVVAKPPAKVAEPPAIRRPSPPPARPRPSFTPKPDADGNIRVTFLKPAGGIEGVGSAKVGDEATLPFDQAMKLVKATVAEFWDYLQ